MGKKYKFSPKKTLDTAQSLYEKKLTTYPRTDTEYINEDVYNEIEKHIDPACKLLNIDKNTLKDKECLKKIVQDKKVTGHHALLPTDIIATDKQLNDLTKDEMLMYEAICKRFIALFLDEYEYLSTEIITEVSKLKFLTKGTRTLKDGYKTLYKNEKVEKDEDDEEDNQEIPELNEGDKVKATFSIKADKTKPEPRYTGSTIISLMEKNHIGTPATMASIIDTLIRREYIELNKNKYSVTKYGLDFISIVPEDLKDPSIEKDFEEKLSLIGDGKLKYDDFIKESFNTQKATIERLKTMTNTTMMKNRFEDNSTNYVCPICGKNMTSMKFSYNCECGFKINKEIAGKKLTESNIKDLISKGKTSIIKGFKSQKGTSFDCALSIDKDNKKVIFVFNKK